MDLAICFGLALIVLPLYVFIIKRRYKRVPPGSLGLPIMGQSLDLLRAMRTNTAEKWLQERTKSYGPIWKLRIFGTPTVFLQGQVANKFIYTCDGSLLSNRQPTSIRRLLGERNLLEMSGDDHKRIRVALLSFLKPEALKQNVRKMDEEIRLHLEMYWHGKEEVKVLPLAKILTFNILASLLFGMERGARRDKFIELFQILMEGMLSFPINLPFTRFSRSIKAHMKIKNMLWNLLLEKRAALEQQVPSINQDLITCMLRLRNEDNSAALTDEEILDNCIITMVAGHDTSSILITFLVKLLAGDPSVYAAVAEEQEEIAKRKASDEPLTWDDLAKMKYTWRVATETLRMTPPVFFSFRRALQDIEFGGHVIPKGWQVMWALNTTHMDENIFPNPSKFDPTRYEQATPPPFSFVAFGGGPRMCPGYEFSKLETLATIHYLVTRFRWKFSIADNSFSRDPMPVFNQGLLIQIEKKKQFDM